MRNAPSPMPATGCARNASHAPLVQEEATPGFLERRRLCTERRLEPGEERGTDGPAIRPGERRREDERREDGESSDRPGHSPPGASAFARGEARESPQDEDECRRDGADEPRAGARIGKDHEKRGPGQRCEKSARDAARGREGEQRDDQKRDGDARRRRVGEGALRPVPLGPSLRTQEGKRAGLLKQRHPPGEKGAREQGAVQHGGACLGHEPRSDPVHARRDEQREQGAEDARKNLVCVLAENIDREGRPDAAGEEIARAEPHESRRAGHPRDRCERAKRQEERRSPDRRARVVEVFQARSGEIAEEDERRRV